MNKQEFLGTLKKELSALPRQDRKKTLDFYRETIDDRLEEGLTEEQVLADIGPAEDVAAQILAELPRAPRQKLPWFGIVLLVLGFPVWLPLLISAAAVLLAVLISLFAAELTLAACGVAGVLGGLILLTLWRPYAALALLGPGLVCLGLSVPGFFLCVLTGKAFWRLIKNTCLRILGKE